MGCFSNLCINLVLYLFRWLELFIGQLYHILVALELRYFLCMQYKKLYFFDIQAKMFVLGPDMKYSKEHSSAIRYIGKLYWIVRGRL